MERKRKPEKLDGKKKKDRRKRANGKVKKRETDI